MTDKISDEDWQAISRELDRMRANTALTQAHTSALREIAAEIKAYTARGEPPPPELLERVRLLTEMRKGE